MPPMVIDLRRTEDARDVVHRAVQALAEGSCVAFPTETDYVIAASGRRGDAAERLVGVAGRNASEPLLSLAIKSADEAIDWAPRITAAGRRLARRCWPGPVSMLVPDDHPESLVHRLPEAARAGVVGGGRLRLRIPGHTLLADCMRMLPGPVLLAEPTASAGLAVTADEVIARARDVLSLVLDDGRTQYAQPPTTIELHDDGFRIVRPGVIGEPALHRLSSLMVLFVCTGNTCRSPMAEALFRVMAAERLGCGPDDIERHGVVIASAGLAAWGGGPASGNAVEAMREMGADLGRHESQPLTESLVSQADVILTMTASHRAAILAQFPEAGGRVAMLSPDRRDVLDPVGGSLDTYRSCAGQIRGHLAARMDTLGVEPRKA
jgi:protein-tyrosine-phosphatase/tRNA A37 threonylcarbamoyladenosine synthetase subunit TsaC/SUA5/YrdC